LTRFRKIAGGRFDPFYYQKYFDALEKSIENTPYSKSKLGNHISEITYGASVNNNYVEDGVPLLRIKDLKRNEINVEEVVYLPESEKNLLGNCFVKENDFLISRSGTIGIVAIVPKDINDFAFGSFMIKFSLRQNAGIIYEFLSYYLNSSLIIKLIARNKIGAIQGNITIPTIKKLPLILPNVEKQQEIASRISEIRQQAKNLQSEATNLLENAKQKIEQMILKE
jgi:restriction endonuclease S subunit